MIRELIHYLHVAEKYFSCNNTHVGTSIYNTVLHSLIESNEVGALKTMSSLPFAV